MRGRRQLGAGAAVGAALVLLLPLAGQAAAVGQETATATAAVEAARVDRFPTPRLDWYSCYGTAQCTTVALPLDYDQPQGRTTDVAVLRVPARDQERRIGSLFVNPGGPGGSATQIAQLAPLFLSPGLLDRFDIVGMDPRGIGASDQVRCFADLGQQESVLRRLAGPGFPLTDAQEDRAVAAARDFGRACADRGTPLAASMSTAQVARDMDVVRRAVGDRRLTYLGFSYGSYLGQVYANLFPDRVRALTIDGVLDPVAWAGTPRTRDVPSTERLRSGEGAYKALREILERCDAAGGQLCPFAVGDPVRNFEVLADRLKRQPLQIIDPFVGPVRFTYQDLIGGLLGALYDPSGYQSITQNLADLFVLSEPPAAGASADRTALERALGTRLADQRAAGRPAGYDFPYDNSQESFSSVLCSETANPANAAAWPAAADRADRSAPHFGRLWTWASVQCADRTWEADDEDAYRGPFTAATSSPVLVVGNRWDPATNYRGAVQASRLLPNSRLLSSDSWGHTAYGSSACLTGAVDRYLLTQQLPAEGTTCVGDVQPFAAPPLPPPTSAIATAPGGKRAPVVPPVLPPLLPTSDQG